MREVFIFVLGKKPQIITETIYCFLKMKPPLVPNEIFILTTSEGERMLKEASIHNRLYELFHNFGLFPPSAQLVKIVLLKDKDGNPLNDIRTTEENEGAANSILSFVRNITSQKDIRIHCSIAGGRKTMGFYLGMAMCFFGRPWDKLYHVLVPEELETKDDFFYPLNPSEDKIEIAELPFVRLYPKVKIEAEAFAKLIKEGQKAIDTARFPKRIGISFKDSSLIVGNTKYRLNPIYLALYRVFMTTKINCKKTSPCEGCQECYLSLRDLCGQEAFQIVLEGLLKIYGPLSGRVMTFRNRWERRGGLDPDVILQYLSKINRVFQDLGLPLDYHISRAGRRYGRRYGILLDRSLIDQV